MIADTFSLEKFTQRKPTEAEIESLIEAGRNSNSALQELCSCADEVRRINLGTKTTHEAAFNAVVPCTLDPLCRYCPYWRNEHQRPMTLESVLHNVSYLQNETSIRQFHLSGGSTPHVGDEGMMALIRGIRAAGFNDMCIVVNCGACFTPEELAELKSLDVLRVFSVFETTDPELFSAMKPGDDLERKKQFARDIARAGLHVGTGLMAGLGDYEKRPGLYARSLAYLSTMEGLDCLYISKFRHAQNIEINSHPECPLDEALALVACARLMLPSIHIRAAAGWRQGEAAQAAAAGAGNLIMGPSFSQSIDTSCFSEQEKRS